MFLYFTGEGVGGKHIALFYIFSTFREQVIYQMGDKLDTLFLD